MFLFFVFALDEFVMNWCFWEHQSLAPMLKFSTIITTLLPLEILGVGGEDGRTTLESLLLFFSDLTRKIILRNLF